MATKPQRTATSRAIPPHPRDSRSEEMQARSRANGLRFGLRSGQIVLPPESAETFDAYLGTWIEEWAPCTEARRLLVEQAAATGWKLKRCHRAEALRLEARMDEAARKWDESVKREAEKFARTIEEDSARKVAFLREHRVGVEILNEHWVILHRASSDPIGWDSVGDHHNLLCALLGIEDGDSIGDHGDLTEASLRLARYNACSPPPDGFGTLGTVEAEAFRVRIMNACRDNILALNQRWMDLPESSPARLEYAEKEGLAVRPEDQTQHRYAARLDRELKSSINTLIKLGQGGADLEGLEEACTTEPIAEVVADKKVEAEVAGGDVQGDGQNRRMPTEPKPEVAPQPAANRQARRKAAREARLGRSEAKMTL